MQGAVDTAASADPAEGEDLARKERKRILELVQSRGMQRGSYPQFDVAVKGQKVVLCPQIFWQYICLLAFEKSSQFCAPIFVKLSTLYTFYGRKKNCRRIGHDYVANVETCVLI